MKPTQILLTSLLPFATSAIADTIQFNNANISVNRFTNQTLILSQLSTDNLYEHQVASHLSSKLQTCIGQVPSGHGLLFQIEDRSEDTTIPYVEQQSQSFRKRGLAGSVHKGWKAMPFDQRVSVVSTVAGTVAVPMYLLGAGIGFNEYEISNFKEKLLSSNKTHQLGQSITLPPPPAPIRAGHRKRNWTETVQDYLPLVKRSPAVEKAEKVPKQRNAKVDSVLGMIGAGNAILYLTTAGVSAVRVMAVRQSDTSTYKRSITPEMKGFTVTCIPVEKLNDMEYQIPKGGLLNGVQEANGAQLTYVNPNKASSNEVTSSFDSVNNADLSNGHHRVLVKRAVIPLREEVKSDQDLSFKEKSLSMAQSHKSSLEQSPTNHHEMQDEKEEPFYRRQGPHNHPEGHPGGNSHPGNHPQGEHHDPDGPVHVLKHKHIYHLDPMAAKGPEHEISVAASSAKKSKSNVGKALAFAAGGATVGYIAHSMYQSSLQQQQQAAAAAAAQAQAYGDDEAIYEALNSPASKRGLDWTEDLMVKRSISQIDEMADSLSKRSPGGGPNDPAIVFHKHVFHHYNVRPDQVPTSAYHPQGHYESGKGVSSSGQGLPMPAPPPGAGSGSGSVPVHEKHVIYEPNSNKKPTGKEYDHDEKGENEQVEKAPKKKGMGVLTKVALVGGGAMTGAYLHAKLSPNPPPPAPVSQGYYDDGTGSSAPYKKRDLPITMKKRNQLPMSVHQSYSNKDHFSPDYLDYYNHFAKRDLVRRKHDSYDDYIRPLKDLADDEDGEKKVGNVITTPAKIPTSTITRRDKIDYNFDGKTVHFSSSGGNQSVQENANGEGEEDAQRRAAQDESELLQRRDSNIKFDTDENNGVHFHANVPSTKSNLKSTGAKTASASDENLDEEELERRAAPVKITYENEADGSQYFSATTHSKDGASENEEADDVTLERRDNLQNIIFDHSKNGSHFAATLKDSAEKEEDMEGEKKEESSQNLKELEAMLQRRDHDHHDVDYHTNKNNEVTFHASTPYTLPRVGNDTVEQNKEKGITIHIVPRDDDANALTMIRRNRIVADR